jgi:hypothetical protein
VPPIRLPVIFKVPLEACKIVGFVFPPEAELLEMLPIIEAETVPLVETHAVPWLVLFLEIFAVTITLLFSGKVPPAAAVPPPTKVPAFDAIVIRFTLTFWSIVTVKPFA